MRVPQQCAPAPSELAQDQYIYNLWLNQASNEDPFYRHLLNAFRVAVTEELTEQQRTYIVAYYCECYTMAEIAEKFAVNKATVSRTINRAQKKLGRVLRYASPSLLNQKDYIGIRKSNRRKRKCQAGVS